MRGGNYGIPEVEEGRLEGVQALYFEHVREEQVGLGVGW